MSRNRTRKKLARPTLIPLEDRITPLLEAARNRRNGSSAKSFSLAWDENEAMGITPDMRRSGPGMLSDQERKETLYQAYLNSVWISACVDVIAKRITSGGMIIELTENGTENQAEYDTLHTFLHYINDDEDFLHYVRSIVTDLLIYGEAYSEVVYKESKPFSLHKIDCITMNYKLEQHGKIIGYEQNMTHSTETVKFAPNEVMRWWLADPKANKKALSPIERILGPVDAEVHMADWVRAFFRKGARPNFWIKFPGSKEEAQRFIIYLRENYTGQANAHIPLVLFDEAELYEIGKGSVDIDFLKGRELACKEILAAYQVPPALVGLIESGNIGGGTGESQEKSFQFNACDPIRHLFFEKFNYAVVNQGFKITNYRVNTRYSDYRSDDVVVKINDMQIRNGSLNVNEVREHLGKSPVPGGDTNVLVASRDIVALETFDALTDEHEQNAQLDLELKKAQVDKVKNPPQPPPMPQQLSQQQKDGQDKEDNAQERIAALEQMVGYIAEQAWKQSEKQEEYRGVRLCRV